MSSADSGICAPPAEPGWGARLALGAIRAYKWLLSPLFTGSCRYFPSCSEYTAEAIRRFGVVRGGWLGLKRLGRCQPWGSSGYDPVPDHLNTKRKPNRPRPPVSRPV